MVRKQVLVDSSFLFALYDTKNLRHPAVADVVKHKETNYIIPFVVLTEAAFLFNRAGGLPGVIYFLKILVQAQPEMIGVTVDDINRVHELMAAYPEARLDFVDCCIMALSERLQITDICTLDRRDFQIFRPKHCDYLTVLP